MMWCTGTLYFIEPLACLFLAALLMIKKLEFLAEQVAIIVNYFLVAGMVSEILVLRRESHRRATEKGKPAVEDTAG